MKIDEIREIMDCLPKGRTKFYYFKDRYALMLLAYLVGDGRRIRDIKSSRFGRLIHKPVVEKIIRKSGCGRLTPKELGSIWPDAYHFQFDQGPPSAVLFVGSGTRRVRLVCPMIHHRDFLALPALALCFIL